MNNKSPDKNKKLATELSKLIYNKTIDNKGVEGLIKELFSEKLEAVSNINDIETIDEWEGIGIWKEEWINNKRQFVKDNKFSDEFIYWADAHMIPPKKDKFRIVLLGESVARGYLLDPDYNPAIALQKILNKTELETEVIDLARTNCSIQKLEKLSKECVKLEPDAIVVLAGNNWIINAQSFVTPTDIKSIINSAIDKDSLEPIKDCLQGKLDRLMDNLFQSLKRLRNEHNVPVVLINPEFNLKDWKSNSVEQLPLFSITGLDKWYSLRSKAEGYIKKEDYSKAIESSHELIRINPTNPIGYELIADCKDKQGDYKEAIKYYRLGRDTIINQMSHYPGVINYILNRIRIEAERNEFLLVDLPEIFSNHLKGVPDRRLFLDYCHFSVEGINLAMYYLAKKIALISGGELSFTLEDIQEFGPKDNSRSIANFLAAIHNAHWGQDFDVVYYHCAKALSYFDISNEMKAYVNAVNSLCPWRLNKHFQSLIEEGSLSQYLLLAQPEDGFETLDLTLTNAILKSLKDQGDDITEKINTKRINEHFGKRETIDLLNSFYWLDYNNGVDVKLNKASFYKEYSNQSKFYLILDDKSNIKLELVHRTPFVSEKDETLKFELNGEVFYTTKTSSEWRKEDILVPHDLLMNGINTLKIHWPIENIEQRPNNHVAYGSIELLHKFMHPVIGELHSLVMLSNINNKENKNLSHELHHVAFE